MLCRILLFSVKPQHELILIFKKFFLYLILLSNHFVCILCILFIMLLDIIFLLLFLYVLFHSLIIIDYLSSRVYFLYIYFQSLVFYVLYRLCNFYTVIYIEEQKITFKYEWEVYVHVQNCETTVFILEYMRKKYLS